MSKLDVRDFVLELLEQAGCRGIKASEDNIQCSCPYHNPRINSSSFGVNYKDEDKGYPFNCFSCKERGNLVQLVSYLQRITYKKALKVCKRKIVLRPISIGILQDAFLKLNKGTQKALGALTPVQLPVRADSQQGMLKYLKKRRRKYHNILRTNYIINKYRLYYCMEGRMSGRIVMPIFIDGKLAGYNDRTIDDNARQKSLHLPDSNFELLLYGLHEAQKKPNAVIVEGAFDLFQIASILSYNQKLYNEFGVVCLMGTTFNEHRLGMIFENFDKAILLLDNDEQGRSHSIKIKEELEEYMPTVNATFSIPYDKDPGKCTKREILKALSTKNTTKKTYVSFLQRLEDERKITKKRIKV